MDLKRLFILAFFVVLMHLSLSVADEIIPVGRILNDAPSFAQHLVAFRGTVERLEQIPSFPIRGCLFLDRYKGVIKDETGSIEVLFCGSPTDQKGKLAKGDKVVIRAVISVITSDGFHSTVLATAKQIERAIESNK